MHIIGKYNPHKNRTKERKRRRVSTKHITPNFEHNIRAKKGDAHTITHNFETI